MPAARRTSPLWGAPNLSAWCPLPAKPPHCGEARTCQPATRSSQSLPTVRRSSRLVARSNPWRQVASENTWPGTLSPARVVARPIARPRFPGQWPQQAPTTRQQPPQGFTRLRPVASTCRGVERAIRPPFKAGQTQGVDCALCHGKPIGDGRMPKPKQRLGSALAKPLVVWPTHFPACDRTRCALVHGPYRAVDTLSQCLEL